MKEFSWKTKVYIVGTIIIGGGALVWILWGHKMQNAWPILALAALASLALFFKVEGATNRSHYNIGFLVYGFTFLLLGPEETIAVILISNLIEWIWQKYPWYIQLFNIASFVLVTFMAGAVYQLIDPEISWLSFESILAVVCSMAAFTLLNHLFIGLVVWLARGENFIKSGVFDIFPLMIDFTLLCMGAGTALIWSLNPFAILLTILPLYLIYATLKVPALKRETEIDPKTGLYNARYFSKVLEKELDRANNFDRPLTVAIADLDLLRNINNTYGHLAGDEVLIGVANILKDSAREYDTVARFGGEEFVILMPETSPEEAYSHIEEMRTSIETAIFTVPTSRKPIEATLSFGIAGRMGFPETPNNIIHNADSALYHSKLNGRNRTCAYTDQGFNLLFGVPEGKSVTDLNQLEGRSHIGIYRYSPNPLREPFIEVKQIQIQPETPLQTNVSPRSGWLTNLYIALLIIIAFPAVIFIDLPLSNLDWFGLMLFACLVITTELLSIDIYVKNTSVSLSAAPILAGTLLYGPLGAMILALTFSFVVKIKNHNSLKQFVFNSINQLIAGLMITYLIIFTGNAFSENSQIVQLLICLVSGTIFFFSTTFLVSFATSLDTKIPIRKIWKDNFGWLTPYYVSMGVIAYALILGYQSTGMIGLAVILVPLLMLRLSVKQYIDRTISKLNELRGKNTLLEKNSLEINQFNEDLLNALAEVVDLRDPYNSNHSQHVARYAVLISKELGLPEERISLITKASLLHDIGQLGIPDALLLKPSRLTKSEYKTIHNHPIFGAELLRKAHSLTQLSTIVRHHHECFDGSGYPDKLIGKEIPLESRILAVAEAIEAMATDRPYRKALSFAEILEQLNKNAGTQFDPMIVQTVLPILQAGKESSLLNSNEKLTIEQCEYAHIGSRAG